MDLKTQLPILNDVVKTELIKWVDFQFDNTKTPTSSNISVLPFLKQCFENITKIVREIEIVIK